MNNVHVSVIVDIDNNGDINSSNPNRFNIEDMRKSIRTPLPIGYKYVPTDIFYRRNELTVIFTPMQDK